VVAAGNTNKHYVAEQQEHDFYRAAATGMQQRYSHERSLCLSVRLSNA